MSAVRLPSGIEAILFDFDGVLADTEPIHWSVWRALLSGQGIDLTWDYYRDHCIGITDRLMLDRLARLADPPKSMGELQPLKKLKKQRFQEHALAHLEISDETKRVLDDLRGVRLGVVTSSTTLEIDCIVQKLKIKDYFETIVFGDQVRNHKPDPEPYLEASRRLGIRRALVFEDSNAGMLSATEAGHLAVRVPSALELPNVVRSSIQSLGGDIS